MKLSNFIWLLVIILVIAIISLIYTSMDNNVVEESDETNIEATADIIPRTDEFGDVEYSKITFNNSFEHTVPGEYSEIIVDATGFEPGQFTIMYVRKAGTKEWIQAGGQEIYADDSGRMQTRFRITEYGDYEVWLSDDTEEVVSPVITVN